MAVIIQILRDLADDLRQFGGMFTPFRVAQDMIERDFLPY